MRASHLLSMLLIGATSVGAAAGCGADLQAQVGYPSAGMIQIEPGVWVVDNATYPTYFAADAYWYLDGGLWYRRPHWGGSWARVNVSLVPGRLAHREHQPYRTYVARNHAPRAGRGARVPHMAGPRRR